MAEKRDTMHGNAPAAKADAKADEPETVSTTVGAYEPEPGSTLVEEMPEDEEAEASIVNPGNPAPENVATQPDEKNLSPKEIEEKRKGALKAGSTDEK